MITSAASPWTGPAAADGAEAVGLARWARWMLSPGVAVIVDVETTDLDGRVIEICVCDAATGAVLLDTLVDPGPVRIAPDAVAVHGISALELLHAPVWTQVVPVLDAVVEDRILLAYNADFDRGRITADCHRTHSPSVLTDRRRWQCVMAARTAANGTRLRLGGTHRARGDVAATRALLLDLAVAPRCVA